MKQAELNTVESKQIEGIVASIVSNKSPGIDKIPIRVIKDWLAPILRTITSIVNCSIETCTFPSEWKIAEVIPIPKEGDNEKANNNRPISLLPEEKWRSNTLRFPLVMFALCACSLRFSND